MAALTQWVDLAQRTLHSRTARGHASRCLGGLQRRRGAVMKMASRRSTHKVGCYGVDETDSADEDVFAALTVGFSIDSGGWAS
ncbi:SIMPL domain-containing protein [Sesbania bispinosa]|nr:SIMPL domain-containing protein [Sesbania bispinosa]